jgi:hypothetical protein
MRAKLLTAALSALVIVGIAVYLAPAIAVPEGEPGTQPPAPPAAPPGDGGNPAPEPAAPCGQCDQDFCPTAGVRCTLTGCTGGKSGCCEYSCSCDSSCTAGETPPANACNYSVPCCVLCVIEFCKFVDHKCTITGCEGNCCFYDCQDEACFPTSCPPNTCGACS